jgi:hypothetical protein
MTAVSSHYTTDWRSALTNSSPADTCTDYAGSNELKKNLEDRRCRGYATVWAARSSRSLDESVAMVNGF